MQSDAEVKYENTKKKQLDAISDTKMPEIEVFPVTFQVSASNSSIVNCQEKKENYKNKQLDAIKNHENPKKMQLDAAEKYENTIKKQLDAKCDFKMPKLEVLPVTFQVSPSKSCIVSGQKNMKI